MSECVCLRIVSIIFTLLQLDYCTSVCAVHWKLNVIRASRESEQSGICYGGFAAVVAAAVHFAFQLLGKIENAKLTRTEGRKRRKGQDSGAEKKRKEKGRQLIRRSRRAVPLQIVKRGLTFFIDKNLPLLLLSKIEFENSTKRKKNYYFYSDDRQFFQNMLLLKREYNFFNFCTKSTKARKA